MFCKDFEFAVVYLRIVILKNMIRYSPYMLATLLSAAVILVMGVCLLFVSAPKGPELRNYRIARRFLAGAYIVLAAVGLSEVLGDIESGYRQTVMALTLIAASFQSLLFTFATITLINMGYMTARKVWGNVIPISLASGVLLAVLFATPEDFYPVFHTALALYCLQLVYYITLFVCEYRRYRRRFDNFFSGNEYHRLAWIRNAFCMAACVGVAAIASLFVSTQAYIAFTTAYTAFYIYFAVKFINYIALFHRIAPVVAGTPDGTANAKEFPVKYIRTAIDRWIGSEGFLSRDISLELLAQALNTNPAYLSRYINTEYGQNFRSWINSLRIAEAQRLITENAALPLAEIGEKVGIPSSSTFYRQFTAVTGVAPAEYRKKLGGVSKAE